MRLHYSYGLFARAPVFDACATPFEPSCDFQAAIHSLPGNFYSRFYHGSVIGLSASLPDLIDTLLC